MTVATVHVARVYDHTTDADGRRILIDRLWPRGMSRSDAQIDQWCKQVAPSTTLRKWYGHDPRRFAEFSRRYRSELQSGEQAEALTHLRRLAKHQTLTLLTASRDVDISAAVVLAELLRSPSG
ncbi:MAG TPA: DUF488 family protein [Propionibacteriaceae bacterium]|nr:DUF488 family protein [Propionibacteriaceae bacterium]